MKIQEVNFDIDDKTLFSISDLPLKADAIRYSILPKLDIINNEIIARLIEVYGIDFYADYSVVKSPHFRLSKTQRKEATKTDYTSSGISITGQRKKNKWFGLDRGDGVTPSISPTQLSTSLDSEGLSIYFMFNHPRNFTKETYKKFFDFFIENTEIINGLSSKGELNYAFNYIPTLTLKEDLNLKFSEKNYDVIFFSRPQEYPINYEKINDIIFSFIVFFPVLNACIKIALNEKVELEENLCSLKENLYPYIDKYYDEDEIENTETPDIQMQDVILKAQQKIKVQAGIRWQVFKRDNWKCVACGRSAEDNVILHIDHIIPRSKGGKNEMENYQTLCETCNIGKSNKDETNLRERN